MEETREETPQDLRNLALKVAGLLEEAGQHALHDQLNPRNLAQPSTENADRGPRYKLEVDNKIMRFMSARIADIAHFDGFWTTRPAESRPGQRYWYIGKIDGVINYVRRMSEWTVTAALFEFGPDNEPKPIIGIVHAPALGLTYLAARGAGAVRIHKTAVGEKRDKVVPSMTSSLDGSVLSYGMSFIPSESQRALDFAVFGHVVDDAVLHGPAAILPDRFFRVFNPDQSIFFIFLDRDAEHHAEVFVKPP